MKYAVYDTWVNKKEGEQMHFDIIVPENVGLKQVIAFGKDYLTEKSQSEQALNTKNCVFCHLEFANPEMLESIQEKGYYILEMQGCD